MTSHTNSSTPNPYPHTCIQYPPQPYIAPGLSYPDNNSKFLGVFTASHLSICLLVSGFGLIVTGLLGVVTRASLDQNAFQAVGIALICFGSLLVVIAIAIFVFAIRWGRKKVHVLERPNPNANQSQYSNSPITLMPVSFPFPVFTNPNPNQNNSNNFENFQNIFNTNPMTQSFPNQTFYAITAPNGGLPNGQQQFVVLRPTAPPQTPDSENR